MKRKKKSVIKTTKHEPKWKRELRATGKALKREAWNALAGLGIGVLMLLIASNIGR